MQLPIVAPAPLVITHANVFRDLFENRCQFHHCQNYLTGLITLGGCPRKNPPAFYDYVALGEP